MALTVSHTTIVERDSGQWELVGITETVALSNLKSLNAPKVSN